MLFCPKNCLPEGMLTFYVNYHKTIQTQTHTHTHTHTQTKKTDRVIIFHELL